MHAPRPDPVAVIGAGAIGLALSSALARTGRPIVICGGRTPIGHVRITESGSTTRWPATHTNDPATIGTATTVILAVKAQDTAAVGDWLRAVDRPGTTIVVAQNGVEHRERVAPYVKHSAIVPAIVYLNVERTEPGSATLRRVGDRDFAVPDDAASAAVAGEFTAGGMRVAREPDLVSVAWAKLLTNITANPITALTGRRAEVMRDASITDVARTLMTEALAVARAEGARLSPGDVDHALDWLHHVPEGSTTSMREDRLAGRPLEYDALTGAVLRAADRNGIPAPANRLVFALLSAIQPKVQP